MIGGGGGRMGAIARLHAFPRPEQHLTQQTASGGIVTLVGGFIVVVLLVHEISYYVSPSLEYTMGVDMAPRDKKLPIFFDITFPALPCQVIELDTMDSSGEADMDLHGSAIRKTRLDSNGYRIATEHVDTKKRKKEKASSAKQPKKKRENALGGVSHLEAKAAGEDDPAEEKEFDNPWEAVMNLFNFTGLETQVHDMQAALNAKEGCRVSGSISVARVAGNLHISVHVQHFYIVQRVFPTSERINMSHFIHYFGFGVHYPGRLNPLDGVQRTIHPLAKGEKEDNNPHQIGTFKYFLKIVPTTYKYFLGRTVDTNQFSVSEYFQPIDTRQFGMLPALNFMYDLSPITVVITESRKNFFHFITRLCAVIGGAFALIGMFNKLAFFVLQQVTKPSYSKLKA